LAKIITNNPKNNLTMTNWKNIHQDFTSQLQTQWENNSFTYNQAQDWINVGLKPTDCPFAVYLRDVVNCEPEQVFKLCLWYSGFKKSNTKILQSQTEEDDDAH
jgi:hypothetical protein